MAGRLSRVLVREKEIPACLKRLSFAFLLKWQEKDPYKVSKFTEGHLRRLGLFQEPVYGYCGFNSPKVGPVGTGSEAGRVSDDFPSNGGRPRDAFAPIERRRKSRKMPELEIPGRKSPQGS